MAWFSCFAPFGMCRFSSEPSQAEKVYQQLCATYGDSFTGPNKMAAIKADAIMIGAAQAQFDSAAGQFNPLTATALLPDLEAEKGISPAIDASDKTRRLGLAAEVRLRNGARADAMEDGLEDILGDDFVAYYVNDAVSNYLGAVPTDPTTSGSYKQSAQITVVRLTGVIMPSGSAQTVGYSYFAGDLESLKTGDTLIVDPGINGITEAVEILTTPTSSTFTAVFTKPHDPSTLATTAPYENQATWQRFVMVAVTTAALSNRSKLEQTKRFLKKWTRVVSGWAIIEDDGTTHGSGPFKVGQGRIGQTPIGAITY